MSERSDFMTEREIIHNEIIAKALEFFDKTITVLCDERPGFDSFQAHRIANHLRENGYYVMEKDIDDFCKSDKEDLGFLLIIPHAMSLPAICSKYVRHFIDCGGSLLTFGGVLFGKYVDKVDGKWTEIPLPDNVFDSVHTGDGSKPKAERIVIEGIVPTYKTYRCNEALNFEINTLFTEADIKTDAPLKVVCPVPRSYGGGYNMGYRNRYIPIAEIKGKSDRGNGNEGAAAFIMLSDTAGHNPRTNLVYPGTVSMTALGSAAACIGIMEQNLIDIKGVPELIISMVDNLSRGLHIFNAGADKFVYKKGEKAVFGAKIHNSTIDFKKVKVCIKVKNEYKNLYRFEKELLCVPLGYTEANFECENFNADDYIVETELILDEKVIDRVYQEIYQKEIIQAKKEEFVKVKGDNFFLGDKPWYGAGMNYWPLYAPGLERTDYWLSWLDKTNYFPEEVEKDLALMENLGINVIFTRLDGDVFGRQNYTIEDFLHRLRKHNIKLCISFANATAPIHYNGDAFRKFINDFSLKDDPVIFAHDISWENDCGFLAHVFKKRYDKDWEKWLVDRYGSIENAECDFGVPIDRKEDGSITLPLEEQFANDGEWRIKIAAYRRFIEDNFSKVWQKAIKDIRSVAPNHLVSYRRGPFGDHAKNIPFAIKHTDFNSHEAYHIEFSEEGYHSACSNAALFDYLSNKKPMVWAEYGLTLTGMNRTHDFVWDHEMERPMAFRMKMTEDYNQMMQKVFMRTGANCTAPWWWPGGLRMVEMSDCGYCGPDGVLRPFGKDYAKFIKNYFNSCDKPEIKKYRVKVDFDSDARGVDGLCRHYLIEHDIKAEEQNCALELYTDGTGTNSANTPMIAVGNVPCNGSNPPKYLDGEFNYLRIITDNGDVFEVEDGDVIEVSGGRLFVEAGLGNLKEAKWLSPKVHNEKTGCVYVVSCKNSDVDIKIPITEDTEFLGDTYCEKTVLCDSFEKEMSVSLCLCAENRTKFGEILSFVIKCK